LNQKAKTLTEIFITVGFCWGFGVSINHKKETKSSWNSFVGVFPNGERKRKRKKKKFRTRFL